MSILKYKVKRPQTKKHVRCVHNEFTCVVNMLNYWYTCTINLFVWDEY